MRQKIFGMIAMPLDRNAKAKLLWRARCLMRPTESGKAGESEDSFRRRLAAELDAERSARCSFCRKHDWEVGRLVASTDGRAFLCDECEASAHVVMTETPVPPPRGAPPIVREPIRIDWRKLPHHQTHGPR